MSTHQTFPLFGGLDQETGVASIPPGRVLSACNYEAISRGYQRTQGFERFDGHYAPSEADVFLVTYDDGGGLSLVKQFEAGDELFNLTQTTRLGYVLEDATLISGEWETNDAVASVLAYIPDVYQSLLDDNDSIATNIADPSYGRLQGAPVEQVDITSRAAAQALARALIEEVPGTGPVRGVVYFNNQLTAWRDKDAIAIDFDGGTSRIVPGMTVTGGTSGATGYVRRMTVESDTWGGGTATGRLFLEDVVGVFQDNETLDGGATGNALVKGVPQADFIGQPYYSTTQGWVEIDMGSTLPFFDGAVEFTVGETVTGGTSSATGVVRSMQVTPDAGSWDTNDAQGVLVLEGVTGMFEAEEQLGGNLGGGAYASSTATASSFPAGGRYEFEIHNFYGTTGTEKVYGVNGVGQAFDFDGNDNFTFISTGMPDDTPFLVQAHKKHLFLGFPRGSLQHSALGDPLSFDAVLGATELGLGHELTAIVPNAGGTLTIATEKSISVLYGNDISDWQLETVSVDDTGAKAWTMQRIGQTIYLDERGVRSISATAAFGGFKLGSYTSLIQKLLLDKRAAHVLPAASAVVKSKDQYLLFFDDGSGISIYFGRKQPEPMQFNYPFEAACVHVAEYPGGERVFVGADDGFVYELNKGQSFDGAAINAYVQLPFMHQGGPQVLKRYHKAKLDLIAEPGTVLNVAATFDLGDGGIQPFGVEEVFGVDGGGGLWGTAGETVEISPMLATAEAWLQGLGSNMSLIIYSSATAQESDILQTATVFFTPRSPKR